HSYLCIGFQRSRIHLPALPSLSVVYAIDTCDGRFDHRGTTQALTSTPLHSARGSPRSRHLTFLTFRPQTRGAAHISLQPPSQRMQCVPGFVLDPQTRRSTPPNQVRYPTDRQFVSGCSPPCLTATQLPSTTRSWLASTRTSTALMRCPLGRTDPGLRRDDDVVESRQIQRARLFRGDVLPTFVAPAEAGVQASARMARRLLPGSRPTPGRRCT